MYHFYVSPEDIQEKVAFIRGNDYNHIKNVLRLKKGEGIVISDNNGASYFCHINSMEDGVVTADIETKEENSSELSTKLVLFQGLPKKDKFELIIQKAVELGVHEIVPVLTKRTIVKLQDEKKEAKKLERWQSISEAAAKQSGRGIIPVIRRPVVFKEALKEAEELEYKLIPYELEEGMPKSRELVREAVGKKSIGVFIGPEGGFEVTEVEAAREAGFNPISLGKRILRTETAGITMLSILMFELD